MTRPAAKGWCPGAYRPMASGDGLIVRVRPRLARLTAAQASGLCDAALDFGNGQIDLTSRANLQIRGVSEATLDPLLEHLATLQLLDETPEAEARRNILTTPMWQDGDLTCRLHNAICQRLGDLPNLPAKMGIALDTGAAPMLRHCSADFRFELAESGTLILRADGANRGREIAEHDAVDALIDQANWFVKTDGFAAGRMAKSVTGGAVPKEWQTTPPRPATSQMMPGPSPLGPLFGAPFGAILAGDLKTLIRNTGATAMRVTPWRSFLLENATRAATGGFITQPDDPVLAAHACPGAPACTAASVETRELARALAAKHPGLHVSGCAKGCAHPRAAATTLVGRDGAFDLVKHGAPWEEPTLRGLSRAQVMELDPT